MITIKTQLQDFDFKGMISLNSDRLWLSKVDNLEIGDSYLLETAKARVGDFTRADISYTYKTTVTIKGRTRVYMEIRIKVTDK